MMAVSDVDIEPAVSGPRASYHHGDLRNGFIGAGLALVAERGVHGFSLREAARALGVSPSAAYRHFADKESLLEAIADDGNRCIAEAMTQAGSAARAGASGPQAAIAELWAYARAMVDFALANPAYFRVMGSCKGRRDGDGRETPSPALLARDAFGELIAAGVMRADDMSRALIATWAGVFGLSTLLIESTTAGARDAASYVSALDAVLRTAFLGLGVPADMLPPIAG